MRLLPGLLCIVLLGLSGVAPALAQTVTDALGLPLTGSIDTADKSVTLPLTFDGEHLFVSAQINGKPVRLGLDSGAPVSVLSPEAARRVGLIPRGSRSFFLVSRLDMGAAQLSKVPFETLSLDGLEADGLLGEPLFRLFTVTLDYQKQTLTLRAPQPGFVPPRARILPLLTAGLHPAVSARVGDVPGRFVLDTGNWGTLVLYKAWTDKNRLSDRVPHTARIPAFKGVEGWIAGETARLPSVTFGDGNEAVTFPDVPAILSTQARGAFASPGDAGNIGNGILSRFHVTFDWQGHRLFLEETEALHEPFATDRSGLTLDYPKTGRSGASVLAVLPGSAAALAGIAVRDRITRVGNLPVAAQTFRKVRAALRQPVGTVVPVEIERDGKSRIVTLTLRDVI